MSTTRETYVADSETDLELDGTASPAVAKPEVDRKAMTITDGEVRGFDGTWPPLPADPEPERPDRLVSVGSASSKVATLGDPFDLDPFEVPSEPVFTAADFVPKLELTSGDLVPLGGDLGPPSPETLARMNLGLETTSDAPPPEGPFDEPRRSHMGRAILATGTWVGDRYEVLALLGQGGMADVYRVMDSSRDAPVALKLLDPVRGIGTARARFVQELTLLRQLKHPSLPEVYDHGEWNGRLYLSMELLQGESVRDFIGHLDGDAADPALVARVGTGVAQALQVTHAAGVIHRDVKPANVFLSNDGSVKLLDFGVAKPLLDDPGLSATGTVPGTPAYLAPEILVGKMPSASSDLWSLGVLLYELATGRRPFASDHIPTLIRTIRHVDPMPPTRHNPRVPMPLERLILRLLVKDPRKRPRDAASLELLLSGL